VGAALVGAAVLLRIGHRGAAALAPENTIAAIRASIAAGVNMVEFDVAPGLVGARDATLRHDIVTAETVAAVHRNECRMFAWTVNISAGIERMAALVCDGVITDDPRLFHEERACR
jgi:glycerophosphoryl diester phosphodiesterase